MPPRDLGRADQGYAERARTKRKPSAKATVGSSTLPDDPAEKIDRLIAGIPDWRGGVLATIRRIMLEADPAVTEDWKWRGSPVWYCDGMVCVANAHREKVKWTFSKGAHFADPGRLFNAGLAGNEWRAIDIYESDRLDETKAGQLVRAAVGYNRFKMKNKTAKVAS